MDVKKSIAAMALAGAAVTGVLEGTAPVTPTDTVLPNEIVARRTETTQVFDNHDGTLTANVYTVPVHFKDKDDAWRSIDPKVKKRAVLTRLASRLDYETASGRYNALFDSARISDYVFRVGGISVTYEALFDGLDVKTETSRTGVKQTVTMPKDTFEVSWRMTITGGTLVGNNFISSADGERKASLSPPRSWDANGRDVPTTYTVSGDTLTYRIEPYGETLWPVYLDPTTNIPVDTNTGYGMSHDDVYLTARNATTSDDMWLIATQSQLGVGQKNNSYDIFRTFINNLTSASLFTYYMYDQAYTDFNVLVHTATISTPLVASDWNSFDGWQSSGAYNGTQLIDTWNTSSYSEGWMEYTFNDAGKSAILLKSSDSFVIVVLSDRDATATEPSGKEYIQYSKAEPPYLKITYTEAPSGWGAIVNDVAVTGANDIEPTQWNDITP